MNLMDLVNCLETAGQALISASTALTETEMAVSVNQIEDSVNTPDSIIDFMTINRELMALAHKGYSQGIKHLIKQYGVQKLSEIDPSCYNELLTAARALDSSNNHEMED